MAGLSRSVLALMAVGRAWRVAADPWLALLIRVVLARAFLAAQIRMMMLQQQQHAALLVPLGAASHMMQSVAGSGPGGTIQALCPVLLAAGLFSRAAALAMLLQALLLPTLPAPVATVVLWAVLLGWIAVAGPGAVSLDRLFSPGARTGALPVLAAASRGFAWSTRHVAPVYLLGLRLCLAAVLVLPSWIPGVPGGSARPAASLLLTVGVLTRPVALALGLSAPLGPAPMAGDAVVAWLLLTAVLLVQGGGLISLDRLLAHWARAVAAPPAPDLPHVVVVGGGFGGIAAVQGLRDAACRITLIDRRNHTLFQPLLYQVATGGLSPADIATPIREMLRSQANVRVLLGEVSGVDVARRALQLGSVPIAYDYLVLATGARHSYFGRDDWSRLAPGLKSIEDATDMRRRLLLAFEEAEKTTDLAARDAWLTFVIVGGGPTGVELAGAIAELSRHGLAGEFRAIDPAQARVKLIQSGPRLLPAFPDSLSAEAELSLRRLGVEVLLNTRVKDIRAEGVTAAGPLIATRTVFWAAGVKASEAAAWLGAKADASGRIEVGADLSVPNRAEVFVVGDTAASMAWNGEAVPGLAPAAKQGGHYVARVIRARLAGRAAPRPFRYRHMGSLATIGRQAAVAAFGPIRLHGAVAWWLWGIAHILFLIGGRNRLIVSLEWLWAYLTYRGGTRLITGPP